MGSVAGLLLTLCAAGPVAAQQANASVDRATITFAVSQLHEKEYGSGWGGDIELSGGRTWSPLRIGWVAEGGLNEFDGFGEFTLMGGVRFGPRFGGSCSARIGSIIAHSSSGASQIGGSGSRTFFGLPIAAPPALRAACLMPV